MFCCTLVFGDAEVVVDRLVDMTDVNVSAPANNEVLKYSSSTSKWINGTNSTVPCSSVTKTTSYTLTTSDCTVIFNTTSGALIATLPTAVGSSVIYNVKRSGASNLTINTTSSQTIDGDTTAVLIVSNTSLQLHSDGSNWRVI